MKKKRNLTILIMGLTCINLLALLSLTTEVNTIKTNVPTLNHMELIIGDSVVHEIDTISVPSLESDSCR